jgi:hypothetical protein
VIEGRAQGDAAPVECNRGGGAAEDRSVTGDHHVPPAGIVLGHRA